MRLRIKSKQLSKTITIEDATSVSDLISLLNTFDDLKEETYETITSIKYGFPPKAIDLNGTTVSDQGIKSGDQLSVEYKSSVFKPKSDPSIPSVFIHQLNQYLILRNVPDDNSCLFNAVNYAIHGFITTSSPQDLRQVIVKYVQADPDLYSEIALGRSPDDYCSWISKPNSWGGAIELGILASWLDVRIVCLDIELGRFIHFQNEDKKPNRFITLVYSGIHYDLLVLNEKLTNDRADKLVDSTSWSTNGLDLMLDASSELCGLLQLTNYVTNTTTFRVRCLECYEILLGENGASKHATDKGHYRFGEVKST